MPHLPSYVDCWPLRSRGAFHAVSARSRASGEACVVLVPGPSAERDRVAAAFAEIERVHALLEHPAIPRVTARGDADGLPFLELGCAAVLDGHELVRVIADAERKIPYAAADAFIVGLREALQHANATLDPARDAPLSLGRISLGNVLFDRAGRTFLVGFGRNFPVETDTGAVDATIPLFQAPELASDGLPSLMGDYTALIHFMRSLLPLVELPPTLARLLRGELDALDGELLEALTFLERRVMGQPPPLRASMDEAIAAADRLRELLGVAPDRDGFARFVTALLEQQDAPGSVAAPQPAAAAAAGAGATAAPETLVVDPEGRWLAGADGSRRSVGRGLRGILLALVARHEATPGEPLSVWELVEAGWPDERPLADAGANRTYVSLTRLRALGLRDLLERRDGGYCLRPGTRVLRAT